MTRSFLEYSWGREAFLSTLCRLTPPAPASPSEMAKSFQIMRDRLKQKAVACYGFPLALQLMAFKAIPAIIQIIHEPDKTTIFLEEPGRCNTTNTLLHFEDILHVEVDTDVPLSGLFYLHFLECETIHVIRTIYFLF